MQRNLDLIISEEVFGVILAHRLPIRPQNQNSMEASDIRPTHCKPLVGSRTVLSFENDICCINLGRIQRNP